MGTYIIARIILKYESKKSLENTDRFLLTPLVVVFFVEARTFPCLTFSLFCNGARTYALVRLCPQLRSICFFRSLLDVLFVDVVMC